MFLKSWWQPRNTSRNCKKPHTAETRPIGKDGKGGVERCLIDLQAESKDRPIFKRTKNICRRRIQAHFGCPGRVVRRNRLHETALRSSIVLRRASSYNGISSDVDFGVSRSNIEIKSIRIGLHTGFL